MTEPITAPASGASGTSTDTSGLDAAFDGVMARMDAANLKNMERQATISEHKSIYDSMKAAAREAKAS